LCSDANVDGTETKELERIPNQSSSTEFEDTLI